ncbi:MAG: hypothetical protein IJO03_02680 [Clostridia bacterium]|nr:hypothetical protein [Clostridia bacterium]
MNGIEKLRNADVSICNADKLVDLRCVEVNRQMPLNGRAGNFIVQTGNPYLFKVDDVIVKIVFSDGKNFSEILTDIIVSGK